MATLAALGWGAFLNKIHAALARTDESAFFELTRLEKLHRQSLLRRVFDIADKKRNLKFTGAEPIDHLPLVARIGDIHLTEKSFDKLRAEIGMVV